MRVKCVLRDARDLNNKLVEHRLRRSIHLDGPIGDLGLGKIYNVVGLQESDGGIWVMLDTVEKSDYPYPYPIEMFEIIDCSLPGDWCINFVQRSDGAFIKRIGFREWATDETFYERLIDGDQGAIDVYRRERTKLSLASDREI